MIPSTRYTPRPAVSGGELPAPIRGMNAIASLAEMPPDECPYTINILAEDRGLEVRDGNVEWANGWTGGPARTVITFEGNVAADDKLWVANEEGIWDVTTEGTTAPVLKIAFPSAAGDAGICTYVNYSNDGLERYVLLCDGENGYHVYTQSTDTWVKIIAGVAPGDINGADPNNFNFVMIWKNTVWFLTKDTGEAWYLDTPSTFTGTVVKQLFARQFVQGGPIRAMYNWTLDGGIGVDDYLIVVSGGGDVLVYQGTDVVTDLALVGSWNIGQMPSGNRFGVAVAGDVYLLSIAGLLPVSRLLGGSGVNDPDSYLTAKIAPFIRGVMDTVFDEFGWGVHVHPQKARLTITSPVRPGESQLGFSMYLGGSQPWGLTNGIPSSHTANWQQGVYWTDVAKNKIYQSTGFADEVYLDPAVDGDPQPVRWQMLSAYSDLGEPVRNKRVQFITPRFVGVGGIPVYEVQARYDYALSTIQTSPSSGQQTIALWDSAIWGQSNWSGGLTLSGEINGGAGIGKHVAIAMKGESASDVTFVSFDVLVDYGGWI